MPDAEGKQKSDSVPPTTLHASKQPSGSEQYEPHGQDVEGDPTAQDVASTPVEERGDPHKHNPGLAE